MSTEDEEGLEWAGDRDDRLTAGSTSKTPVRTPRASPSPYPDVVPVAAEESAAEVEVEAPGEKLSSVDVDELPTGLSSREGIMLGVLGGFYLLFSAAWIVTALRNPVQIADPLGSFMFIFGLWMAAFAPAAWFAATLVGGRRRSFLWRFVFLALGAAIMIPWPYFSWAA